LGLTGTTYQAINGAFLVVTFFCCRLVWGTYGSVNVFNDVLRAITTGYNESQLVDHKMARESDFPGSDDPSHQTTLYTTERHLPCWLGAVHLASNVVLGLLNFYLFLKMIQTIRKRFDRPLGTTRTPRTKDKVN